MFSVEDAGEKEGKNIKKQVNVHKDFSTFIVCEGRICPFNSLQKTDLRAALYVASGFLLPKQEIISIVCFLTRDNTRLYCHHYFLSLLLVFPLLFSLLSTLLLEVFCIPPTTTSSFISQRLLRQSHSFCFSISLLFLSFIFTRRKKKTKADHRERLGSQHNRDKTTLERIRQHMAHNTQPEYTPLSQTLQIYKVRPILPYPQTLK